MMFFPAIAARQFIPNLHDAGDVYPMLCAHLLPAGMLGLVIAAMFAATMSTLSSDYNVCASVLTNDVYRRLIRPSASQKELVSIGRLMTLVIGVIALATAFFMARGKAENLFRIMVTLFGVATAPVAVPMLLGLVSKRFTSLSAMTGFICGIGVGLGLFFLSRYRQEVAFWGMLWKPESEEIVIAGFVVKMEIVLFVSTALVTFVAMALTTWLKPMEAAARAQTDAFLKRLDTPIGELDEDQRALTERGFILSPFRVVGVSILAIGVMMLCILPWATGSLAFSLDLFLSVALLVIGGLLMWRSGARPAARGITEGADR